MYTTVARVIHDSKSSYSHQDHTREASRTLIHSHIHEGLVVTLSQPVPAPVPVPVPAPVPAPAPVPVPVHRVPRNRQRDLSVTRSRGTRCPVHTRSRAPLPRDTLRRYAEASPRRQQQRVRGHATRAAARGRRGIGGVDRQLVAQRCQSPPRGRRRAAGPGGGAGTHQRCCTQLRQGPAEP